MFSPPRRRGAEKIKIGFAQSRKVAKRIKGLEVSFLTQTINYKLKTVFYSPPRRRDAEKACIISGVNLKRVMKGPSGKTISGNRIALLMGGKKNCINNILRHDGASIVNL